MNFTKQELTNLVSENKNDVLDLLDGTLTLAEAVWFAVEALVTEELDSSDEAFQLFDEVTIELFKVTDVNGFYTEEDFEDVEFSAPVDDRFDYAREEALL